MAAYLDFVLTMFFAFGIAFEVPVAVVLLVLTGLVKVESLVSNRGYVIIGIFVVAAVLDAARRDLADHHGVPDVLLYEGGLVMARIMQKMRREAAEPRDEEAEANELASRTTREATSVQRRDHLAGPRTVGTDSTLTRRHSAHKNSGQTMIDPIATTS